ncbi:MAG: hypothetical protein AB7O97_02960 [Planctomycetota bacterium]
MRTVLLQLAEALPGVRIVVVGATALRHHLGDDVDATLDLDLCAALELDELRPRLPTDWRPDPRLPHRWRSADGTLVDLLPAGPAVLAVGEIRWPDGSVMDMTGLDLAMRDAAPLGAPLPDQVRVASLRALFVAKVAA